MSVVWVILGSYILLISLLNIPAVKHFIADTTTDILEQKLGTEVCIDNIGISIPNRIIIDGVLIYDQSHKELLESKRLSAKVDILPLFHGEVSVSSIQLFGVSAHLSKANAEAPFNFQFILDSLKSKDNSKKKTPLNLHISSIVIRNSALTYDRLDMPRKSEGLIDINHLALNKISGHFMLPTLTDNTIDARIKKLSFVEAHSNLNVSSLTLDLKSKDNEVSINNFNFATPESNLKFNAFAQTEGGKIKSYKIEKLRSAISTKELSILSPKFNNIDQQISLSSNITGTDKILNINTLNINNSTNSLILKGKGELTLSYPYTYNIDIDDSHLGAAFIQDVLAVAGIDNMDELATALNHIDYKGQINGKKDDIKEKGLLSTALGDINHSINLNQDIANVKLTSDALKLGLLPFNTPLGDASFDIEAKASIKDGLDNIKNAVIKASIPQLAINSNTIHNITLNAQTQNNNDANIVLEISDPLLNCDGDITVTDLLSILKSGSRNAVAKASGNIHVDKIAPYDLGLTKEWPATDFSFSSDFVINNINSPLEDADILIEDFAISNDDDFCHIDYFHLTSTQERPLYKYVSKQALTPAKLKIDSDFCRADISGAYDISTLWESLVSLVGSRLPTLPGLPHFSAPGNEININADITDATPLQRLFNIDIQCDSPISLDGYLDDVSHEADIRLAAPDFTYNGTHYKDADINIYTTNDTLVLDGNIERQNPNMNFTRLSLRGHAVNNKLNTTIAFNNGSQRLLAGEMNADMHFINDPEGRPMAMVDIQPSLIITGDTIWSVRPATISYSDKHLSVHNFSIEHNNQHISINGVGSKEKDDALVVDLQDIDVAYILDLVNFTSVDFDGCATGKAIGRALFSDNPEAEASLKVDKFEFSHGQMGTLFADADFNLEEGQINIRAHCEDSKAETTTVINGFISPKNNELSLNIDADGTPIEFMNQFCESFMQNVDGTCKGKVFVGGPLNEIDLIGDVDVNASLGIIPLGTTYFLKNTRVSMRPKQIVFENDTIRDKNGALGIINGKVNHFNLAHWTYNLGINVNHLLCYDFPQLTEGSTFCGHIVASGKCNITGRSGEVVFDVEATPERTSFITYDVSSPDALQNQEFITWGTASTTHSGKHEIVKQVVQNAPADEEDPDFTSDIRMNLLIHTTPDACLRFLMDATTGDAIELYGSGALRANYYNKSGLQIYGNYLVDHGTYRMTIQQLLTKEFTFLPEGGITFSGEPFESAINLHAKYELPSVPLSDLNIGNSFSNNSVRVNCLMNINGTAEQPRVDFALELPQASSDIQQMITSIINSEDEMNQQVVYLLAIGRFYSNANNASSSPTATSQTSLAMQSFISGTLSQQLNNAISGIMKNQNWNFGANVSPGDEGMNNAEYEGIVNGRLLNNRLLINGQFGYRDNVNATSSFIGDFDVRYLLLPNGNIAVHVYNQTSDRYFSRSTLNTQGLGIILKHDFNTFMDIFRSKRKPKKIDKED